MKIKDIMTRKVKYIEPTVTLKEAANIMLEEDIGALLIGEEDRLIGVVTDRDITVRAIANGFDPEMAVVKQAMTPKCLYCFEEDSVTETAKNMAKNQVRRLPVMNQDKRLVGIVSLADITLRGSKQSAAEALQGISQKGK